MPRTDLLTVLRNRWLIVLLCTLLGATCAFAVTASVERRYTSTSSLYFSIRVGNTATELNQGASYVAESMNSFAGLATSPVVLRKVRDDLDLDLSTRSLGRKVEPSVRTGTVLLDLDVTTNDPQLSADIANAVAAATGDYARATAPTGPEGQALLRVETVRDAAPASDPSSPQTARDVVAGMLAGLFIGLALGALREQRDDRLRRSHELVEITGVPVLTVLPGRAGTTADRDGAVANAHRRLRLGLEASGLVSGSLVVAAAGSHGDATGVVRGLAAAYAETGAAVVHVDAAGPGARSGADGLPEVVLGDALLDDVLVQHGDDAFWTVPAVASGASGQMFASPAARAVLGQLSLKFEMVLISCQNVTESADAAVLARSGGRVLLVAVLGRDRLPEVVNAADDLAALGAPPVAFVAVDPHSGSGQREYRELRTSRLPDDDEDVQRQEPPAAAVQVPDDRPRAAAIDVVPGGGLTSGRRSPDA